MKNVDFVQREVDSTPVAAAMLGCDFDFFLDEDATEVVAIN
jgi:hypothetical protein